MSQQLGSEVERQGKANKSNYTQDSSFFSKKRRSVALGGIQPTTLQIRECSTTRATQLVGVRITTQHNKYQITVTVYNHACKSCSWGKKRRGSRIREVVSLERGSTVSLSPLSPFNPRQVSQ